MIALLADDSRDDLEVDNDVTELLVELNPVDNELIPVDVDVESDVIELSQLGCEYAQGFAFGQAITAAEARRLVGAASEAA